MDGRHWTDDDFINRLYTAEGGDAAHLAACPECSARLVGMKSTQVKAVPEVSQEFLAAQRRAIYRRFNQGPAVRMRWAPAVAATAMIVVGLFFFRPAAESPMALGSPGDDKVFAEVYAMEQSLEPDVAKPIKGLFEEEPL